MTCVHCGESHPPESKFCPATGQAIQPPAATERVTPLAQQKGVFDLFSEAAQIYRKHARTFLITAAVLFVPGSFISSCALSVLMAPVVAAAPAAQEAAERLAQRSEEYSRRIQEQTRNAQNDPARAQEAARETERYMNELGREVGKAGGLAGVAMGGFTLVLLGLLGWAITALVLYGIVLPLTQGALTVAVADTLLGGEGSWRQHWQMLFKRLGLLISAIIPAAVLIVVGFFFFVVPGIILSFLFAFVTPVVLVEGVGGTAALKRSYHLVKSDWLRTALVLIAFGITSAIAHWVAGIFVPRGALFFGNFIGDLLLLLIMPVPIIGSVLLYFDLRRKVDGLDDEHFKHELETLRPVV